MYLYLIGIALLIGGYATFSKGMGILDGHRPCLVAIRNIGGFFTLIFLIIGTYIHAWWAPIIGILISMIMWMCINTWALSTKFTIFHALRSHIGIFLGVALCLISFFGEQRIE